MEDDMQSPSSESAVIHGLRVLRWPLVVVVLAVLGFLVYRETLRRAEHVAVATVDTALDKATAVVKGFLTGNVTETFLSSLPEFDDAGSGNLELATYTVTETFQRTEEKRVLWDQFSLGTTEAEVRVPVTYRYHLRLDEEWHVKVVGSTCVVWAPAMRPSRPPAIHTDRMEKRVEADWLRFDAADQLEELERSVTPTLNRFAGDEHHMGMARERSRKTVEKFVRDWLLDQGSWGIESVHTLLVIFPDEKIEELPVVPELVLRDG